MKATSLKEKLFILKKSNLYLSISFLLVSTLLVVFSCNPDETQEVTTLNNLILAQEFNVDGAPDPTVWGYDLGNGSEVGLPGWGNNELQYYTDRPENVIVEDGMLVLTAREESFQGASYTSARLVTRDLFETKYGRFEMRAKLPWGKGLWPAFWLLGNDCDTNTWPQCGEIDVMELAGSKPTKISGAIHGPGYSAGNALLKEYDLVNDRFDTGFHIFGVEWGPGYVNFYVDNVLYNQITPEDMPEGGTWVLDDDREYYMLINVAVGGAFDGPPNSATVFPQKMYVDYVRVYN
ncbi:MAG: family 16 glycosylhydrolase [Winogradskyella sp.]|uniref:glycoside hydrolase family 16 protein n=1 Tax=Winogradskyella sp. TaxID=1883156 RepID=UPI00385E739F